MSKWHKVIIFIFFIAPLLLLLLLFTPIVQLQRSYPALTYILRGFFRTAYYSIKYLWPATIAVLGIIAYYAKKKGDIPLYLSTKKIFIPTTTVYLILLSIYLFLGTATGP